MLPRVNPPDHPRLRAYPYCPFCIGRKPAGALACWSCFNQTDLSGSNPVAEDWLAAYEHVLSQTR